jgi:hydrogenase-1 operon protein HyaF
MTIRIPGMWKGEAQPIGVFVTSEADDGLRLLDIHSSETPRLALDRDKIAAADESICELLARVRQALVDYREGDPRPRFALDPMAESERKLLAEILGEGEVAITLGVDPRFEVTESVLPGLWRIRVVEPGGALLQEWLEIGDVPEVVRAGARIMTRNEMDLPEAQPEGSMNAFPILGEVREKMRSWQPGEPNHVVNFTLMPMTPVDSTLLARVLGRSAFESNSRGFGWCKVYLTAHRNVWGVQYFNGMGKVILDTVEIGDIPVALLASQDDYADSALRLGEILEVYQ